jgi:hypothetical protein
LTKLFVKVTSLASHFHLLLFIKHGGIMLHEIALE